MSRRRDRREIRELVLRKICESKYVLEEPQEIVQDLAKRGIGTLENGRLVLSPVEVAYLMTRYKIRIDGEEPSLDKVLQGIDNFLKFVVYQDLRKRGYDVKLAGPEAPIDLLVWDKGKRASEAQPRYGVKIVTEGLGIRVLDLAALLKYCESMGLQLVLALVSNDGVVTYYKTFSLRAEKITQT